MGTRISLRITASASTLVLLIMCFSMMFTNGVSAAEEKLYTKTFRSPGFVHGPGDVNYKDFAVEMPEGHIALRSLYAEVVDENGTPTPLYETYLHHWVMVRFYVPTTDSFDGAEARNGSIWVTNSGVCTTLPQMFGLGSETRRTDSTLPPPYGIVVGDPEMVPDGYKEGWILSVHSIDTRGAVDAKGCTECRCDLYTMVVDENGNERKLPDGYEGGMECCEDGDTCAVKPEFEHGYGDQGFSNSSSSKRTLFMEYTVTWVDMSDEVVPVKVYIFDVTDQRTSIDDEDESYLCPIEYTVPKCAEEASECIHTAESLAFLRDGGDVIYAVAHQHRGGIGSTLYNEDGEEVCSSLPIYGNGTEAGNEAGYIVGMTTCYPEPGSVRVRAGEKLQLKSLYSNEERHTGVMGLFYIVIAQPVKPSGKPYYIANLVLVSVTIIAAFVFIAVTIYRLLRSRRGGPDYEAV
ncbi:unnamed protein product [Calypogeia fissa]